MTRFRHVVTGAVVTYPEEHPLHAVLEDAPAWEEIVPEEDHEDSEETQEEGLPDERSAPARGRGRRAAAQPD